MEKDIVFFDGVPTQIFYFGKILPRDLGQQTLVSKPKKMIVVIPGFPGFGEAYSRFADELNKNTNIPVWIIGYFGTAPGIHYPDPIANSDCYKMQAQAQLFQDVIIRYLDGINVILVAHSVGAWVAMKVLENEKCNKNIVKIIGLFPMFHQALVMSVARVLNYITSLGLKYHRFTKLLVPFLKLSLWLANRFVWKMDISGTFDSNNIIPVCIIGNDAGPKVHRENDFDCMRRNRHKFKLFYCTEDRFISTASYNDVVEKVSGLDAVVDTSGHYQHSFPSHVGSSEKIALLTSNWIRELGL